MTPHPSAVTGVRVTRLHSSVRERVHVDHVAASGRLKHVRVFLVQQSPKATILFESAAAREGDSDRHRRSPRSTQVNLLILDFCWGVSTETDRMWLSIRMITPPHTRPGQARLLLLLGSSRETQDKKRSVGSDPKSRFLFWPNMEENWPGIN